MPNPDLILFMKATRRRYWGDPLKAEAIVFLDRNRVAFQSIDVPEPGPLDVMVLTRYSWISTGTERSFLRGERMDGETPCREGDRPPFPIVPGYQKTGIVEWVGEEVRDIKPGDWVFAATSRVNLGPWRMGGHVSPAVTPTESIWKIPDGVNPVAVSGLVLTQVGYNCATRAPVEKGDLAVIIGDGLVGQWSAQMLAYRGANVILVGRHNFRLCRLKAPNSFTINEKEEGPVDKIRSLTGFGGISVLVDTVGSVSTVESLLPLMKRDGHVVSAGFCGTRGLIDIQKLRRGEITLHCPSGWRRDRMDRTLELIAKGVLDTMALITHRFPADEAEKAWELILNRREEFLGMILEWR